MSAEVAPMSPEVIPQAELETEPQTDKEQREIALRALQERIRAIENIQWK